MSKIQKLEEIITLVSNQLININEVHALVKGTDHDDLEEELLVSAVNLVNNSSNILTTEMYNMVDTQRFPVENVIGAGQLINHTLSLGELDDDYENREGNFEEEEDDDG